MKKNNGGMRMGISVELLQKAIRAKQLERCRQRSGMTYTLHSYIFHDTESELSILIETTKRKVANYVFCCWKSRMRRV